MPVDGYPSLHGTDRCTVSNVDSQVLTHLQSSSVGLPLSNLCTTKPAYLTTKPQLSQCWQNMQ